MADRRVRVDADKNWHDLAVSQGIGAMAPAKPEDAGMPKVSPKFSHVVLYVKDVTATAEFYVKRLGVQKLEVFPTFAMLGLGDDVMLGLWQKDEVHPKPVPPTGGSEVNFRLASDAEVDATHKDWVKHGVNIVETPAKLDFGYAFTALDPDGNRIRMFAPAARM
jgi:predicted enzyme related to lactoylglutathione lyase